MLRFAPSPTGDMHIGNLRVAIFNYIVAKQKNERFLLRIEDTDKERNVEGKDREIMDILAKFSIEWEDTIYQSQNLTFHQNFAYKLLEEKKAFVCFCTPQELQKERERAKELKIPYRYSGKCEQITIEEAAKRNEPFVIRVKKPSHTIKFSDIIKGDMSFEPKEVDSFVILRADGTSTYNFACAIDDMLHDISIVIRGEDHLSNTPKQIYIRKLLGYNKEIEYCHLPIILNRDGKKMSKRENASSVKWLLENGFLPQAIANYLIALGNTTPTEIFTLHEAIEWFDLKKISKAPAKFDLERLRYINREHLKRTSPKKLAELLEYEDEEIGELAKIYLEEASTLSEISQKIEKLFNGEREHPEYQKEITQLKSAILARDLPDNFEELKKDLINRSGLKGKRFFKPLRILLTGEEHGPEISLLYPHLKKFIKEVLK